MELDDAKGEGRKPMAGFFLHAEDVRLAGSVLGHSKSFSALFGQLLKNLGGIFGFDAGVAIPGELAAYEPELWEGLSVLQKLRHMGHSKWWGLQDMARYPDEPLLFFYTVLNTDTTGTGNDGYGFDFYSKKKALWRAIGESIERRALSTFVPPEGAYLDASYHELQATGQNTLDIFSLAGIAPEARPQLQFGGRPLSFDADTRFRWVRGRSLTQERSLLIPLQLVSFKHNRDSQELLLRPLVSTGAAAHRTLSRAVLKGALELIERDAFMITWLNKLAPKRIAPETILAPNVQKALQYYKRHNLEVTLLHLPSDLPAHVILCVIRDRTGVGPAVVMGTGVGFDIETVAADALREALGIRLIVRSGLDSYRAQGKSLASLKRVSLGHVERTLYWCDIKKVDDVNFLLEGSVASADEFPPHTDFDTPEEQLKFLTERFKEKNIELAYVELTDREIKKILNFHAAIVVAPELQPLHLDERVAFTWGQRLRSVPLQCGFEPAEQLNKEPHPFP